MTREVLQGLLERMEDNRQFVDELAADPGAALERYDLTDEERRALILPNFGWWEDGAIAACARPRSREAYALLRSEGVRALLSVTVDAMPADMVAEAGLEAVHFSVEDVPSLYQVRESIAAIDRFVAAGKPVAVHCDAGRGRTGCILACHLVSRGSSSGDAIREVRARRPGSIELPEQETIVGEYERYVRGEL